MIIIKRLINIIITILLSPFVVISMWVSAIILPFFSLYFYVKEGNIDKGFDIALIPFEWLTNFLREKIILK